MVEFSIAKVTVVLANKKLRTNIFLTSVGLFSALVVFWNARGRTWMQWDEEVIAALFSFTSPQWHEPSPRVFWSIKEMQSLLAVLSLALGLSALMKKTWFYVDLCG